MAFVVGEQLFGIQRRSLRTERRNLEIQDGFFGRGRGLVLSSKTKILIWYRHRFTDGKVFAQLFLKESFLDI